MTLHQITDFPRTPVFSRNPIPVGEQHRRAHRTFQLPYVASPRMNEHPFPCFRIKAFHQLLKFLVGKLPEEVRQWHNVLLALAQRRYVQGVFLPVSKFSLVAAMMRTSAFLSLLPPVGLYRLASSARSSICCTSSDRLPISSRNNVPPAASSQKPCFLRVSSR